MDTELRAVLDARKTVLSRIREILINNLGVRREPDEIDPDAPLFGTGLGLDSVDAVELLVSIESAFAVRVTDDVIGRTVMRTVNTLVDLVLHLRRQNDDT